MALTLNTTAWHCARLGFFLKLWKIYWRFFIVNYELVKSFGIDMLHWNIVFYGLCILVLCSVNFYLINEAIDYLLKKWKPGLKVLRPFDEFWINENSFIENIDYGETGDFVGDPNSHLSNYVVVISLNKTTISKAKDMVNKFVAMNSFKLVQIFGRFYWVPLGNEANFNTKVLSTINNMPSKQALLRQVAEKMHLQIDLTNSLPFRFYFVEDCLESS